MASDRASPQPSVWHVGSAPHPMLDRLGNPLSIEPPSFDPHPAYLNSSQSRHWTFHPSALASLRRDTHEKVSDSILQYVSETPHTSSPELLSVEDEMAIMRFYLMRIGKLVKAVGLPSLIEATAMSYMKRFYLRNSCMQFHPKLIMLTSIYLASKAENYPIPLAHFCAQVNKNAGTSAQAQQAPSAVRGDVTESILSQIEFGMVQSLGFELGVHGAHRALYGFILDIQTVMPHLTREDLLAFAASVQPYLHFSRLTDAEFLFTPSHIALASCWMCDVPSSSNKSSIHGKDLVMSWLKAKEERGVYALQKQQKERDIWRQKQRVLGSEAAPELDSRRDEASAAHALPKLVYGLGLPIDDIVIILERIADMIHSVVIPGTIPPKPSMDVDRVKQVDLKLRCCLSTFETVNREALRKRPAEDTDDQIKRVKIET